MKSENQFSRIRFCITLTQLIIWVVFISTVYFLSLLVPFYNSQRLSNVFHAGVCKVIGLKVVLKNTPINKKPVLFVSNHVSYLDIFSLGKVVPAYFVAKAEIASWPLVSVFAKMQNTVFVERRAGQARNQIAQLNEILEGGDNLILFPEGTSTNGAEVLPFKSSLFAAAESESDEIWIQAISLCYTKYQLKGMNQSQRDSFAWYADMPFTSHFIRMMGLPKVEVEVSFNEPVLLSDFNSRKECALACEEACRESFTKSFISSASKV